MSRTRRFHELSDLPSSHVLNACQGWLSIVVPIARTNLITNPSVELATTNYTAVGGSIARSTTQQYHGAYSLVITPSAGTNSDGVFYGTVSLTSGTTYAYSCKVRGTAGRQYKLSVATTGGVDLTAYTFTATGRWQWVWGIWTETSSTSRRIYLRKNAHSDASVFYLDGLQVEACETGNYWPTTYIDGDQQSLLRQGQFPPAYLWNGPRHAATSTRSANTRDGGRVLNMDAFKFLITAFIGLGLVNPTHIAATQTLIDGAAYQTSIVPPRQWSVSGRFATRTNLDLKTARKALGAAFNLDATAPRQPLVLLYQEYKDKTPQGDPGKIIAAWNEGLQGQWDNTVTEDATIAFTQFLPAIIGADEGAGITTNTTFAMTADSNLVQRSDAGVWSNLALANSGTQVSVVTYNPIDACYYIGGTFTTLGGVAANRIAKYDPTTGTISALGTGMNARVEVIEVAPDGQIYAGGIFTTAGGTTVNAIARWDGSAWNALGSGGTKGVSPADVGDIAIAGDGSVYLTGLFTAAGGSAANYIVKYTPSSNAFSTMSSGLDDEGSALAIGLDGTVYVGGAFLNAGGGAAVRAAAWNGSSFSALSSGLNDTPLVAAIGPDGALYMGGGFTTAGGLTVNGIARWNGSQWLSLGLGISGSSAFVSEMVFAADGLLYIAGSFTTVNGSIGVTDGFAAWNGSAWILPDIDLPGSTSIPALTATPGGGLLLGTLNSTANATAALVNTLTYTATAPTYPVFYISGPSSGTTALYQLRSYTTRRILSFNLTILPGELITIRCSPTGTLVTSSFRGDISNAVIPGSSGDFYLVKGANSIAVFTTGSAITMNAVWPKQYASTEELIYQ